MAQEKILLIGRGGREMALLQALLASPSTASVIVAPGSEAMQQLAPCFPVDETDLPALLALARREAVSLTIVGPEAPLALGIADLFAAAGQRIFAPTRAAARIETSKAFAKELMAKAGVPTAAVHYARSLAEALSFLEEAPEGTPLVLKENGLRAGKGVLVTANKAEAREHIATLSLDDDNPLLFEEYLTGPEFSLIVLAHGERYVALPAAQDHKRLNDGQQGPNTGGMGAVSPVAFVDDALTRETLEHIIEPVLRALAAAGTPFTGFLYAGLAKTTDGPKVIEFNARLGDPEAEVILPRCRGDFTALIAALLASEDSPAVTGQREESTPQPDAAASVVACDDRQKTSLSSPFDKNRKACLAISPQLCLGAVLSAPGYPGKLTGHPVIPAAFLEKAKAEGFQLVHMGTKAGDNGDWIASGGRVLLVSLLADDLSQAQKRLYTFLDGDAPQGFHYRHDLGNDSKIKE